MSMDMTERSFKTQSGSTGQHATDKLVLRMELEDSVFKVDWSLKDAWVFAATGFNGTLIVGTVPSKEKYRILL